jgi:hypothetical protein
VAKITIIGTAHHWDKCSIDLMTLIVDQLKKDFIEMDNSAANDWNELQKSLKLETLISLTSFKHQLSEQLTDYYTCT